MMQMLSVEVDRLARHRAAVKQLMLAQPCMQGGNEHVYTVTRWGPERLVMQAQSTRRAATASAALHGEIH